MIMNSYSLSKFMNSLNESFDPNVSSEEFKQFVSFLDNHSLNYDDFIDWISYKFNQNIKVGISTLEYNLKVKSKDNVLNILKSKGYSINDATSSTGIKIQKGSETVYVEGKHYDTTKEGEKPFIKMVIKDVVLNKLYPQLAYYVEYNSEYNYLRSSICYGKNIQTLDITPNAKSIAGYFVSDEEMLS